MRRSCDSGIFQSTLPARGATYGHSGRANTSLDFNPRSPHGERPSAVISQARDNRFQSTLPARGATTLVDRYVIGTGDFNPRSPHGERHDALTGNIIRERFQSTLPARGATWLQICSPPLGAISIHAPRTGSDETWRYAHTRRKYFNPRSPHGERREQVRLIHAPFYFNPRSPHGERHNQRRAARGRKYISIHAPRTGSDGIVMPQGRTRGDFNPRSPHGERPSRASRTASGQQFQSTLPARGATPKKVVS